MIEKTKKEKSIILAFGIMLGVLFLAGNASALPFWNTISDLYEGLTWESGSAVTYNGINFTFGESRGVIGYIKPKTSSDYNTTLLIGVSSSSGINDLLTLNGATNTVVIGSTSKVYFSDANILYDKNNFYNIGQLGIGLNTIFANRFISASTDAWDSAKDGSALTAIDLLKPSLTSGKIEDSLLPDFVKISETKSVFDENGIETETETLYGRDLERTDNLLIAALQEQIKLNKELTAKAEKYDAFITEYCKTRILTPECVAIK